MSVQIDTQKKVICSACRLQFQDVPSYKLHRSTEFHIYNTKRQIAELDPISEEVFEQKKATLAQSEMSISIESKWKCSPCNKIFKTMEQLDEHKKSKKHKRSEKEYFAMHPDATQSSIFKSFSQEVKGDIFSDMAKSLQNSQEPLKLEEDLPDHKVAQPVKTTLESLRICLFCNLESDGVKMNLDHMRLRHNFAILDIECLINLKGLLAYIAERIQLGKMCLMCSKQFRSSERAQQHMMDKGHCMMSIDADQEFEIFYDFSRAYRHLSQKTKAITDEAEKSHDAVKEERKILASQRLAQKKEGDDDDAEEVSSDDWEDVDVADGDQVLEEIDEEEEKKAVESSDEDEGVKSAGTESFTMLGDSKSATTDSFTLIDTSSKGSETKKTESFDVIGDSHSSIAGAEEQQSTSSFSQLNSVMKGAKRGKTRQEAFNALEMQKAELLGTGEIKLPSGKIIGHRDYKYIYRQKPKLPDERESVVINKLALEYRNLQNGGGAVVGGALVAARGARGGAGGGQLMVSDQRRAADKKDAERGRYKEQSRVKKNSVFMGVKNSSTMMLHFRLQYDKAG